MSLFFSFLFFREQFVDRIYAEIVYKYREVWRAEKKCQAIEKKIEEKEKLEEIEKYDIYSIYEAGEKVGIIGETGNLHSPLCRGECRTPVRVAAANALVRRRPISLALTVRLTDGIEQKFSTVYIEKMSFSLRPFVFGSIFHVYLFCQYRSKYSNLKQKRRNIKKKKE